MSILFGLRHANRQHVFERELKSLAGPTRQYALDGSFFHVKGDIGMGYQPYHTHFRSKLESQPSIGQQGDMLTFDGRLDNHDELRDGLQMQGTDISDSIIVLAAFERWGEECFKRLVGDWALALWSSREQALYLARDHAGTRTLYYRRSSEGMEWSTCLDTFIRRDLAVDLEEAYASSYLLAQSISGRTPYKEIETVPPACYIVFKDNRNLCRSHWDWSGGEVRYRRDQEYQEHFLELFKSSVKRRTQPGFPILAELSGGMDSSSIVCISDSLRSVGDPGTDKLIDTISYFEDSEPEWNERPYVTAVEFQRKKQGIHVARTFSEHCFQSDFVKSADYLLPGADRAFREREQFLEEMLDGREYRVVLSGIGGDEVLGGAPSAVPTLADYLVHGRLVHLMKQAVAWSLSNQVPMLWLLAQTTRFTRDAYLRPDAGFSIPPWVTKHTLDTYSEYDRVRGQQRLQIGRYPSRYNSALAWASIKETLARKVPPRLVRREYRYPYLDKDLVEFLIHVPPEQLAGPGRRRALMRSALKGIVPEEILERKQKAVVVRKPLIALGQGRSGISALFSRSLLADLELIDVKKFLEFAGNATTGNDLVWIAHIARTIYLEIWLQGFMRRKATQNPESLAAICLA